MIPKFQNPHLLFQQTEPITREELGYLKQVGPSSSNVDNRKNDHDTSAVDDLAWLKRHVEATFDISILSGYGIAEGDARVKKRRKDDHTGIDGEQANRYSFRLVSSSTPEYVISLEPKPLKVIQAKEREYEDNFKMAKLRRKRAVAVAVDGARVKEDGVLLVRGTKQHGAVILCVTDCNSARALGSSMWIAELNESTRRRLGHVAPQLHKLDMNPEDVASMALPKRSSLEETSVCNYVTENSNGTIAGPSSLAFPIKTICPVQTISVVDTAAAGTKNRRKERRRERRRRCHARLAVSSNPTVEESFGTKDAMYARMRNQARFWCPPPEVGVRGVGYAYGYADSHAGGANGWRPTRYVRDRMKKVVERSEE